MQGRELRLESARLGLEGAVGCLRTELQASQGQVEERGRELTKARAHQHSMEKKNKVGAFYVIICMGRGGGWQPLATGLTFTALRKIRTGYMHTGIELPYRNQE